MAANNTSQAQQNTPAAITRAPASPPLPPQPTRLTPGPRAAALQHIFERALKETLKNITYNNFATCFPTPASHASDALADFHRAFVERLGEACRREFEGICIERDIVRGLNELDELVNSAKRRRKEQPAGTDLIPPHLRRPEEILHAHLQPFLDVQAGEIEAQLITSRQSNDQIAADVLSQRGEIEGSINDLESVIKDLETAANILGIDAMKTMDSEIEKTLDFEMRNRLDVKPK